MERKHLNWFREKILVDLRAETSEDIRQKLVVVQTGLMWSVVSTNYQAVIWILVTPASDMVQKVTESIERSTCDVLTCDASFSSVHQ